jgi:hypothetical protein
MYTLPHDEFVVVNNLESMYLAFSQSAVHPCTVPNIEPDLLLSPEGVLEAAATSHMYIDAYDQSPQHNAALKKLLNLRFRYCEEDIKAHETFHQAAAVYFRATNAQFRNFDFPEFQKQATMFEDQLIDYHQSLITHQKRNGIPTFLSAPTVLPGHYGLFFDESRPFSLSALCFNPQQTLDGFLGEIQHFSDICSTFYSGFSTGRKPFAVADTEFTCMDDSLEGMISLNTELLNRARKGKL